MRVGQVTGLYAFRVPAQSTSRNLAVRLTGPVVIWLQLT